MIRKLFFLLAFAVPLAGCEPLRGVVSEKESSQPVSVTCVDATLRKTFGEVQRWDYVSDGNGFPNGTKVAQLAYFQSESGRGWAALEIGKVGNATRLAHSFTGAGGEIPQEDFPPALRAMGRAKSALQASCNLNLSDMQLKSVGQHVEALELASPNGG